MGSSPAERYVRLGLALGRHVEEAVDAYFGPAELAADVDARPAGLSGLVVEADELLAALEDSWLRDQVRGLRTYAGALAGEPMSWADEVEGCYGVRPTHTDEEVFAAAHAQLDGILAGAGTPAERYRRWQQSSLVPAERIAEALERVIHEARVWTSSLVDLPAGEGVTVETARDRPWWASCDYLGGLHSRIVVNLDLPMTPFQLLVLAIHETYPGHHAERCCKEHRLARGRGLVEETIVLAPTPQTLVSEGIARLAPFLLLESEAGSALAEVVRDAGIEIDLARDLAVARAHEPCRRAEVNAALMMHDADATEDEARAYLERWALEPPEWSGHLVRFITEPTQRTHIATYSAGLDLCERYVAGDRDRFRRLLTAQVRVGEIRDARSPTTNP